MKKLLISFSLIISSAFANAMDFRQQTLDNGTVLIWAQGDIVNGDSKKLDNYLNKNKGKRVFVILNSDGGFVDEALLMGLSIHKNQAHTGIDSPYINKQAVCASACALVFFGGHDRVMTPNSLIGVHQMRTETKNARASEGSAQYWTSLVYQYADTVDLPRNVLREMFATPSNDMFYISSKEAPKIGVRVIK